MNKKTTDNKRAYHHSEAWLKKHAEKLAASKTVAKKTSTKTAAKKRAKKQMAKKIAKKTAKKIGEKPSKHTMKTAIKVFDHAKKHVSGLKKCTKQIGKFISETMKTGDEKYIAKVQKLFARIGYVYTPENQFVTFENNAKVKLPKVKVAKKISEKKDPVAKKPRAKKQKIAETPAIPEVSAPSNDNEKIAHDHVEEPSVIPADPIDLDTIALDTEENNELDVQDEVEELENIEKRDDETDEEFSDRLEEERERLREEREIECDMAADADDVRAQILAEQEDNGDFS